MKCRSSLGEGWPDVPFSVPIDRIDPGDHCHVSFVKVGDKIGSSAESHFFCLQVLEEMVKVKAQPFGSTAKNFDISRYNVRFRMETFPQHPMDTDLAYAALEIIYDVVFECDVREFVALAACQGIALPRFRTWLLDPESRKRTSL